MNGSLWAGESSRRDADDCPAILSPLLLPEPPGAAARAELLLLADETFRGLHEGPCGLGTGEKVHVDATDPIAAKLDIA